MGQGFWVTTRCGDVKQQASAACRLAQGSPLPARSAGAPVPRPLAAEVPELPRTGPPRHPPRVSSHSGGTCSTAVFVLCDLPGARIHPSSGFPAPGRAFCMRLWTHADMVRNFWKAVSSAARAPCWLHGDRASVGTCSPGARMRAAGRMVSAWWWPASDTGPATLSLRGRAHLPPFWSPSHTVAGTHTPFPPLECALCVQKRSFAR